MRLHITTLLLGFATTAAAQEASRDTLESITIARSWREARGAPTEFCGAQRTGFPATVEDRYTWRAVATRSDGVVVDANAGTIGELRACFQARPDSTFAFYAEGALNGVTFTGLGECRTERTNYPEEGLLMQRCFLILRDISAGYIGGHLTANTINSRNTLGGRSDPPGYTQPSIATIRLWKARQR
jgi:hypothetical protein